MHGYRQFCNKIYQATKFVLGYLDASFIPLPTAKLTGRESLADRWILHRMTTTAREVNSAIEARDFSAATSASYKFWYNQLCDVYIENSKRILWDGTPEEQEIVKQTLYTALESGLRLMHPFMCFLTEELWQRLPRRASDKGTPSIVVAKYPIYEKELDDAASERAFDLILKISGAIRTLKGDYAIRENAEVYVQLFDGASLATCDAELASLSRLSDASKKGIEITLLGGGAEKPAGCVPLPVNAQATAFLMVKGRIDVEAEIEKARRKMERAEETIRAQKTLMAKDAFKAKVTEEAQEAEGRKLANAEKEVEEMEFALKSFETLKME